MVLHVTPQNPKHQNYFLYESSKQAFSGYAVAVLFRMLFCRGDSILLLSNRYSWKK